MTHPWPLEIVGTTVILLTAVITIFLRMYLEDLFMWKCHYNVLHVDEPPWSFCHSGNCCCCQSDCGYSYRRLRRFGRVDSLLFRNRGLWRWGRPTSILTVLLPTLVRYKQPDWTSLKIHIYLLMVYHTPNSDTVQPTVPVLLFSRNIQYGIGLYIICNRRGFTTLPVKINIWMVYRL